MTTKLYIFVLTNIFIMHFIYSLSCPITNDVKYIGQTTDLKTRYYHHVNKIENNKKSKWIQELKHKNLKPKLNVLDIVENKKEALRIESEIIRDSISKGVSLLNSNYQNVFYKFNFEGELVDVIISVRGADSKIKMNRYTHNGFVYNTENIFPYWKLEQKKIGVGKQRKTVIQYTRDGIFVNEFNGVREAYKITGIDHRSISANATNRRKSAGGYIWKYKNS